MADLNARGVSGPVRFLLTDATYPSETFPITVNVTNENVPTASSPVTIKPSAGVTATVAGAGASTAILKVFGTNYITIDGSNAEGGTTRDLTLENTSATSPIVVWFGSNGTTPITNGALKNCVVRNGVNTSSAVVISDGTTSGSAGYFSTMEVRNNKIEKAYMGVYATGGTTPQYGFGLTCAGNEINTAGANAIRKVGLYLQGVNGAVIANNDIGNFETATSENDFGIWLATGSINVSVDANSIHDIGYTGTSGYGAKGIAVSTGLAAANAVVSNNMVFNITGDSDSYSSFGCTYTPAGIYAYGAGQGGIRIVDNSVYLYGNTINYSAAAYSVGIGLDDGSAADVSGNCVVNNLGRLSTTGVGAVAIALEISAAQLTGGDYNNLYCNATGGGANLVGKIAATDYAALAAWQAASGRDANSISADPLYAGLTDLHIRTDVPSPVGNAGTVVAGISTDFDGDLRSATPDIGADEYTVYTLVTAVVGNGSIEVVPAQAVYAPGTEVQLTAVVRGWGFDHWSGDATGSDNPVTITMDGDKSVTAHFLFTTGAVVSDVTLEEGDSGTTDAIFTVTLSEAAPDTVEIGYTTADSTATVADNDYIAASGTLVFAPGDVEETFAVQVVGDTDNELDEVFQVLLVDPDGVVIVDGLGLGTIVNDDEASAVAEPMPTTTFLGNSFPNPCGGSTTIAFGLHVPDRVELRVYDLQGRVVRNLMSGTQTAGYKRDRLGRPRQRQSRGRGGLLLRTHADAAGDLRASDPGAAVGAAPGP